MKLFHYLYMYIIYYVLSFSLFLFHWSKLYLYLLFMSAIKCGLSIGLILLDELSKIRDKNEKQNISPSCDEDTTTADEIG